MIPVLGALFPVFGVVVIGLVLKRLDFPGSSFWPYADRLTYFVLFPALLIEKLAQAELNRPELIPMTLVLLLTIIIIASVIWLVKPFTGWSNAAYTSVLQGSIRPNTYVGLAGAAALFGPEGLAITAIAIASVIPLVNIISVLGFAHWLPRGTPSVSGVLRNIFTNPLIIGCIVGIVLNLTGVGLPLGTDRLIAIPGQAALPMGLLSVGAGLQIRALGKCIAPITVSSIAKLIALPGLAYGLCLLFPVEGLARGVVVLYASLPCSVSSYTLASELGGDKELIAGIITVQTLLAMITIPLLLGVTVL
uniref:AEC family transporter n=1 Tax=Roseihalotalea indica TaxID=2867963 RepID=A0AA49GJB0_9BACT|nr:AEC family transporter [Tunicatimonas sp. TK19036]